MNFKSVLPKTNSLMMAALFLTTTLSGCTSASSQYSNAKVQAAVARASVNLPATPVQCRQHVQIISPGVGDKWRYVQAQWELEANAANKRIDFCANGYDKIRAKYAVVSH